MQTNSAQSKVVSLGRLAAVLELAREQSKTIVMCHGVFDLLHPGHIRHLNEAKGQGDLLVVTITTDRFVNKGPGRPVFTDSLRAEALAALATVDYVAINDAPTAVNAISLLRPDVYVKGQDYENRAQDLTQEIHNEEAAVIRGGGRLHFTHDIVFSSTKILNSQFGVYPERARDFLLGFKEKFPAESLIDSLKHLKDLKVAVLGDAIVDEYHYAQPLGKSPKETIVTTRYLSEEAFPGGILACANHIAAFSDHVDLITCLGSKDTKQELIESQLNPKIRKKFFLRDDSGTIVKRRYVEPAFLTKMFQITFLNDTDLPPPVTGEVCRYLREALPQYDLVVVADYGHGFITPEVREVIESKSPFLALNVQTNSANHGYNLVTKYKKADYICIDEPELRLALSSRYTDIHSLIRGFSQRYPGTTITITRGHNGSITSMPQDIAPELRYFESPSLSLRIVDRVGAGDAYFAVTSLLAATKAPIESIGLVGNAAGAMAVEVVCNRSSMEAVPLYKFIKALLT